MDQHMMEGNLPRLLQRRKYHTDNPEEDNVVSRHQHICGEEILQIFRLIRPSQGREWPQGRGKPGIQGVLILGQMAAAALGAFLRYRFCHHDLAALITVIRRDPVSPPELTGDAPVADALQPVQVGFVKALRHESQAVVL